MLAVAGAQALTPVPVAAQEREVVPGIATARPIPGVPMKLAGNRIVFTDWSYVQPGDLDWVDASGKSVYVVGNVSPGAARHVGIEAPRGVRIRAERPQIVGPLERPHRCIIQDGKLYRGWTDNEYYESTDGITWVKKARLVLDKETDGIQHVFIDPVAPAEERYKSVWSDDRLTAADFDRYRKQYPDDWEPRALVHYAEYKTVSCIRGSVSPDGIHWKTLPDPLGVEYSDTLNTAYYDSVLRKYVVFTRAWSIRPYADHLPVDIRNSWTGTGRRAIGRTSSATFRHFPPSELILEAPPSMLPSETLYTNCYTTVPGAPDQHLMFPTVWNASIDDRTRIVMASSHDGAVWSWVPGGDLLETAKPGEWNGGCIWATPNLIELPNGDWALPYYAHNVPHKYPRGQRKSGLGYAVWPKGRMVAIEAPEKGELTMMTVIAPGLRLRVNATTTAAGSILVEVAGKPDRTFDRCARLSGDLHWSPVRWGDHEDLGIAAGQAVTLRFRLDHAAIYGIQFE